MWPRTLFLTFVHTDKHLPFARLRPHMHRKFQQKAASHHNKNENDEDEDDGYNGYMPIDLGVVGDVRNFEDMY